VRDAGTGGAGTCASGDLDVCVDVRWERAPLGVSDRQAAGGARASMKQGGPHMLTAPRTSTSFPVRGVVLRAQLSAQLS
jgi:hypothetical protein